MRKLLLLIFLFFAVTKAYTQEVNELVVTAFRASYNTEATKEYTAAITSIKSVYKENFYEANLRLGWLYYLNKDYDQSVKYYRQAIKIKPNSIEAMLGFINPAGVLKDWSDVFATYQKILSIDPENSLANYRIALMYYYRKEFASAEKHLQKIIDRYPFDYDIVLLMAQVKLANGKLTDSKYYYQRALLYNPSNDEIKKLLEKL